MRDRLCFVQFLHPGGEHGEDEPGLKHWNRHRLHRRKFIVNPGRLVDRRGRLTEEELVFWGEWEPASWVRPIPAPVPDGPRYLHRPFLPAPPPRGSRQNTDPFVFGNAFHYVLCLQRTKRGPTQLRHLARGSVILFGSCIGRSKFVLDTLLVVDRFREYTTDEHPAIRRHVPRAYAVATLDLLKETQIPVAQSLRLYWGATPAAPVHGMFSFFPCRPAVDAPNGFPRPEIGLGEIITPTMTQGKRLNPQAEVGSNVVLWQRVVDAVRDCGLELGVSAQLPSTQRATRAVSQLA